MKSWTHPVVVVIAVVVDVATVVHVPHIVTVVSRTEPMKKSLGHNEVVY